jgi:hypothetical protein
VRAISKGAAPGDVVGPNGETLQELLNQVTTENGGLVSDATGFAIGNPESQRIYDEAMARGVLPKPKGPKPIVMPPYKPKGTAPTGPARPEDAWKWKGIPAGASLIGTPEPGEMRWYGDYDEHGLRLHSLPPAWPNEGGQGG